MGDLNARNGSQDKSQHNFDNHLQHLLPEANYPVIYLDVLVMIRLTSQKELCWKFVTIIILQLVMGKHLGRLGNYTWFSYEGASVVDYLIVEEIIYEYHIWDHLTSEYFPQHLTQNTHQLLLLSNVKLNSKLKKKTCSTHQKPINGMAKFSLSSNSNK